MPSLAKWKAEPSKELAYTIGILHGDGSVTKNESRYQYIVKLAVIDKEFAETFSKVMAKLLSVSYHEPYWNEKKKKWLVKYRSKAFFIWYEKTEKQGLEGFKEYIEYSKETVRHYLKGLFDSEESNYRNKYIYLYNSSKKLLEYVQYLLEKYFDIKATGPHLVHKAGTQIVINRIKTCYNDDYYKIQIGRKEHIQKFLEEIGFSIVRRQLGLMKDEKVLVEGRYIEPYRLIERGLFKLPFNQ